MGSTGTCTPGIILTASGFIDIMRSDLDFDYVCPFGSMVRHFASEIRTRSSGVAKTASALSVIETMTSMRQNLVIMTIRLG